MRRFFRLNLTEKYSNLPEPARLPLLSNDVLREMQVVKLVLVVAVVAKVVVVEVKAPELKVVTITSPCKVSTPQQQCPQSCASSTQGGRPLWHTRGKVPA